MDRRASRLNHVILTLLGLALAVAGGLALARGLGAWGRSRAAEPVLTDATRGYASDHSWFWPAVAGGAVVLGLLGLYWLLAQLRSHRMRGGLAVDGGGSGGETRLSGRAVTEALENDIGAFPGVQGVKAQLTGDDTHPGVRLDISYDRRADTTALRSNLHDRAIPRMRTALGVDSIPAVVRLHLVGAKEETSRVVA